MKKILIIEDNLEVRENICEILELSSYEPIEAENGLIGVDKALKDQPDLILCDIMMPELDGYGVLHILSKKPATVDIPFIFLTAKSEKTDFRKGMQLGADDYITKPFSNLDLLNTIEMRLKKSERIKQAFDGTPKGLSAFIDEARGLKELQQLSENQEVRSYRKKDFIYQEGELPRRLYFVNSGTVKTYRTNDFGKEYITDIYKAGSFFGYLALLQQSNYHETAMAMEDASLSFISKDDFLKLLLHNRDFSAVFVKMLSNNVEEKEEKLLSLAYQSIRKRVAEVLMELYEKNKINSQSEINILRDDLARMVGTAKESVIRNLTDFKNEKLIKIEHGTITVLAPEKLANLPG